MLVFYSLKTAMLKIDPPLYLIGKKIHCWKCQKKMPVIAQLAPNVHESLNEISVLSGIRELPEEIFSFIKQRVPSFKKKHSNMAGYKYFGNNCPSCGVLTGEFFFHSEPGALFFPENEIDAKSLYLREIPLSVSIDASPSTGIGGLILDNATRLE